MRLDAVRIARACAGRLLVAPGADAAPATGLAWDSRAVAPGDLFLAMPGARVDGFDYIGAAVSAGAVCVLCEREPDSAVRRQAQKAGAAIVLADKVQKALEALAASWRETLAFPVVGITGSTGKTTTKNLVRAVLSAKGPVHATVSNQNNELGVPATVLSADAGDVALVVEMGMRGLGQIEALCATARPDVAVVTNVGESHIELLGTRENIAAAKGELLCALPDGRGIACMNVACDMARGMVAAARLQERGIRVVWYDGASAFGVQGGAAAAPKAQVYASDVTLDAAGCAGFTLHTPDGAWPCKLALPGAHNVSNACAAAAVGWALGVPGAAIAAALEGERPIEGRSLARTTAGGVTVVDDAYNANPDSMAAALDTLRRMEVGGRRIAVLGDMGELGAQGEKAHARIGRLAQESGVDELVCVGPLSRGIARAAIAAGMPAEKVRCADDAPAALAVVRGLARPGDAVLVKASHAMGLEHVVEGLMG